MLGEESIISKAQNLSGKHGRRCGGYKREGKCALPGEVCPAVYTVSRRGGRNGLRELKDSPTAVQKSAEGIVSLVKKN